MVSSPFTSSNQSSSSSSSKISFVKQQPESRLNTLTGKAEYVTSSGTVTTSRSEAEEDAKKKKKRRSSSRNSSSSSSSSNPYANPSQQLPQSKEEPKTQSVAKVEEKDEPRVISITRRDSSKSFDPRGDPSKQKESATPDVEGVNEKRYRSDPVYRKSIDRQARKQEQRNMPLVRGTPEPSSLEPTSLSGRLLGQLEADRSRRREEEKSLSLSTLEEQRKAKVSEIKSMAFEERPIYSEQPGQTRYQTGTELINKPIRRGIQLPFSDKRIFESEASKKLRQSEAQLQDIDRRIFEKRFGKFEAKQPTQLERVNQLEAQGRNIKGATQAAQPFRETQRIELAEKRLPGSSERIAEEASNIGFSTGTLERVVSPIVTGRGTAADETLRLVEQREEDIDVLTKAGQIKPLPQPKPDSSLITTSVIDEKPTSITPEEAKRKAKRSIAVGAAIDVGSAALTAGVSAGAVKLASTSPTAFKVVRAIDIIDEVSDVGEIGVGVFRLSQGDVSGVQNIGNIVTGNIVGGSTSRRVGRSLDFSGVAPTETFGAKLKNKLYPVGVDIEGRGFDIAPRSNNVPWIPSNLARATPKQRARLVADDVAFKEVVVEERPLRRERFIPTTEALSSCYEPSLEGPVERDITLAKPQKLRLMGVIEGGTFRPVRRNLPREKLGEVLSKGRIRSKKAQVSVRSDAGTIGIESSPQFGFDIEGPEVGVRSDAGTIGIESSPQFDIDPETKTRTMSVREAIGLEPDTELSARSRFDVTTRRGTGVIPTPKALSTIEPDFESKLKTGASLTPKIESILSPDVQPDITPTTDVDYTTRSEIGSDITPDITPDYTPSIKTPSFDFTPRAIPFRLPRGRNAKITRGRKAKEFTVTNRLLDLSKSFKQIRTGFNKALGIRGKGSTQKGRVYVPKGIKDTRGFDIIGTNDISKRLRRLL